MSSLLGAFDSFSSASFSKLPPLRGTNLATGNQQKHLFLSFPTNS